MELIKVFSGSEVMAIALKEKLEEEGIGAVIRNNHQANVLPSIESTEIPVELFVEDTDLVRANPIIEKFRLDL